MPAIRNQALSLVDLFSFFFHFLFVLNSKFRKKGCNRSALLTATFIANTFYYCFIFEQKPSGTLICVILWSVKQMVSLQIVAMKVQV